VEVQDGVGGYAPWTGVWENAGNGEAPAPARAGSRQQAPGYFPGKRRARGRLSGSVLLRAAVWNTAFCCNS